MSSPNTPVVSPSQKELDSRVSAFVKAIGSTELIVRGHLMKLGVDFDDPDTALTILDTEEFLTFGDLCKAFVSSEITQIAKLRMGLKHLRGTSAVIEVSPTADQNSTAANLSSLTDSIKSLINANRPKENWTTQELLTVYLEDDEARNILGKRTKGRHCIVFQSDGTVNIAASATLISIAIRQPTQETHMVDGKCVKVHRAGQLPPQLLDECPFSPGVALVGNYDSSTNTNWENIPHECRVLAYLYVNRVEKCKLSSKQFREVCKDAASGVEHFRAEYPHAGLMYDELAAAGNLPRLKLVENAKPVVDRGY